MRITKLAAIAATALAVGAPMAFANMPASGTITAINPAAHTITIDGQQYAVRPQLDLTRYDVGQTVSLSVQQHASPMTVEQITPGL